MEEVISDVLTIAIGIFGILVMLGGLTRNPWQFASRPYRWLFRNIQSMIRNIIKAFCRRFPRTAATIAVVLIIGTIATIALAHAGFL